MYYKVVSEFRTKDESIVREGSLWRLKEHIESKGLYVFLFGLCGEEFIVVNEDVFKEHFVKVNYYGI